MELRALMINAKTIIPNLLGTTLSLAGCGRDEPPGPTSIWGAGIEAFCLKELACDPTLDDNAEQDTCREYALYGDFAAQYLSAECEALIASYYSCAAALSCEVFLTDAGRDTCFEAVESDLNLARSCIGMLPRRSIFR